MNTPFPPNLINDPIIVEHFSTLQATSKDHKIPILWSIDNKTVSIRDLGDINHLLVAGAQGQGKSNFIHQLLLSILFTRSPNEVKFFLVDFKRLELARYTPIAQQYLVNIPGLDSPVVTGGTNAIIALQSLWLEIDRRLDLFRYNNARNMLEYRQRALQRPNKEDRPDLPYIITIIDELADLELYANKQLRESIERLLLTAAKTGVIVILSTGVIPGHSVPAGILSGIEERVIFRLFDRDDYRKYLNTTNFPPPQTKGIFVYQANNQIISTKSILIPSETIDKVIDHIGQQAGPFFPYSLPNIISEAEPDPMDKANRDPLFDDAARLIVQHQTGSTSLIQRRMKLGYNRAGLLMDQLEAAGVVGPDQGSKPREVLIKSERELEKYLNK